MPRGGDCDHGRCPPGNCRQLTDEELAPRPEDHAMGQRLVTEQWYGVSTKHRTVVRWRTPLPPAEALIRPEVLSTPCGQQLAQLWESYRRQSFNLRMAPEALVETLTLTLRQWKAFKAAGGQSA